VMKFDLTRRDPGLYVVVLVEVSTSKAISLEVFDNQGFEADREIGPRENYVNFP
jgi:hypothetical protein